MTMFQRILEAFFIFGSQLPPRRDDGDMDDDELEHEVACAIEGDLSDYQYELNESYEHHSAGVFFPLSGRR